MIDPTSLAFTVQALRATKSLYDALSPRLASRIDAPSDRYLNYDPGFLLGTYADEHPISNGIPYTRLCDFSALGSPTETWNDKHVDLTIAGEFVRDTGGPLWQSASSAGYAALKGEGRVTSDEAAIRVTDAVVQDGRLSLTIQKARYGDQAHSNLVLDFDRKEPASGVSLRNQLRSQPGHSSRLPLLTDPRLANTLGIACLVFYLERSEWKPYLVRRVRKAVAVFPGGVHCTASGVAKWPAIEMPSTFENFATRHMLFELREEVGLEETDLIDFRPVALCREMARGGKPQLFYCAFTLLDRSALTKRRKNAARVLKVTNQLQEVEKDLWYRSADVLPSESILSGLLGSNRFTLEGAASFFLGLEYAQSRLPALQGQNRQVP